MLRETHPEYFASPEFRRRTKMSRLRLRAGLFVKRDKQRMEIIARYSNGTMKCAWCGYNNPKALVLDHVNDDGSVFRKSYGRRMSGIEQIIRAENRGMEVKEQLQVLCANCNVIKEYERKMRLRLNNPDYVELCGRN
jgi:hypothetical protein